MGSSLRRECRKRARLCTVRSKIVFEKKEEPCWCPKCNASHKRRVFAEDYEKKKSDRYGWEGLRLMVFCLRCEHQELERWQRLLSKSSAHVRQGGKRKVRA